MTFLSTDTMTTSTLVDSDLSVPFTAYMTITVDVYGKKWEKIRLMEKFANLAEEALNDYVDGNTDFEFSRPVKYTVQFGNSIPRLTINGNVKVARLSMPVIPVSEVTILSGNEAKTGYGCINNSNRVPKAQIDTLAKTLKTLLESIVGSVVFAIDVDGIRYGKGGRTFNS
jgi:hypothetical protein